MTKQCVAALQVYSYIYDKVSVLIKSLSYRKY